MEASVGTPGKACNFDETKSVIGEARLPDFGAAALERVDIGRARGAQIVQIQTAIGFQGFGVAQRDRGAFRTGDLEAAPADHVLAHVEDVNARANLRDFDWLDGLRNAQRFGHLRDERTRRSGHLLRCRPLRIVEARAIQPLNSMRASCSSPSNSLLARMGPLVVSFQVSSVDDARRGTVLVFEVQLHDGFGITERTHTGRHRCTRGPVAAVAEQQAHGIAPGSELSRDIERDV